MVWLSVVLCFSRFVEGTDQIICARTYQAAECKQSVITHHCQP